MTEADKQRLTPVVNQAIERLEREVGIEEISSSPLIYHEINRGRFNSSNESTFDLIFLNKFLSWAYKYRLYCLYLTRTCSISIPLDKIIKIGKDIIQYGFLSDFVQESLSKKHYPRTEKWIYFHSFKPKKQGLAKKTYTYLEVMESLEPQLSRSTTFHEEFREILMKVNEYYLSTIKETEFSQLKIPLWDYSIRRNVSLNKIIEELDIIISYLNGNPPSNTLFYDCSIFIGKKKEIPCRIFHQIQWNHKQLKHSLNAIVYSITEATHIGLKK